MFYIAYGRGRYPHKVLPHLGLRPTPPLVGLFATCLFVVAACGGGAASPTPSGSLAPATVISSEYGRIWGRLPADFPLLAEGSAETRLDLLASGSIFSRMGVEEATRAAVDELRRLAWEVADPTSNGTRYKISALRDQGACTATLIVEPLGSRTSIVVYLGEGCPAP
jgi:hypothetical protein